MIQVSATLSYEGLWAWLDRHRDRIRSTQLRADVKKADKRAFGEWMMRDQSPSMADNFSAENRSGRLQFAERTARYQWRKIKIFGRVIPYVSPRRKVHMRDIVTTPAGFTVRATGGGDSEVRSVMRVRGARVLNYVSVVYRREFLGFHRPQRAPDRKWILLRRNAIVRELLSARLAKAGRRRKKVQ